MTLFHTEILSPSTPPADQAVRSVLIVDDSRAQRMVLATGLRRWGFNVHQAASGIEALDICASADIDLVLSDWMMPGMNGIEFCRALRAGPQDRYIYFILLTSKAEKAAVAEGLDVGADDFLTKPVDPGELHARIKAGERLLVMERALRQQNALTQQTLARLQSLYDTLDRDLTQARKLQLSLLRDRQRVFTGGICSMLLRPSGHVGGDLVGCFDIDRDLIGVFAIDVSGHGVTSALMTARLAGGFSGSSPDRNIAMCRQGDTFTGRDPADVAAALNRQMLADIQTDHYFTLGYSEINQRTGRVRLVQAGHPHPMIQRGDGSVHLVGQGGLPVGLFDDAPFETVETRLEPGERLIWVSDGMTECPDPTGEELGPDGLADIVRKLSGLRGNALIEAMIWEITRWAGTEDLPDDVSCAVFEYDGLR